MPNKNKIPQIKKDIKFFLRSEEGKIVEKDAAKLGIALIAAAGILGGVVKAHDAQAGCAAHVSHGSHSSASGGGGDCFIFGCY